MPGVRTEEELAELRARVLDVRQPRAPADRVALMEQELSAEETFGQAVQLGLPPDVGFREAAEAADRDALREAYTLISKGQEETFRASLESGIEMPGLFEAVRQLPNEDALEVGADVVGTEQRDALIALSGRVPLTKEVRERNKHARLLEQDVEQGRFMGTEEQLAQQRRGIIAGELADQGIDLSNTDYIYPSMKGDALFGPKETAAFGYAIARAPIEAVRAADTEIGRSFASPLTGYKGQYAVDRFEELSTRADELVMIAQEHPEQVTPELEAEFQALLPELERWYPYEQGHLLAGDARWQQVLRGFSEEALRPTSLAAMAVPIVRGGGMTQSILKNAGLQGGTNIAQDVVLGRIDPQELALSGGIGAGFGGAFGGVAARGSSLNELRNTQKALDDANALVRAREVVASNTKRESDLALAEYKRSTGQVEIDPSEVLPNDVRMKVDRAAQADSDYRVALEQQKRVQQTAMVEAVARGVATTLRSQDENATLFYHGSAAPEIEGGALRPGTFVTPDAAAARKFAEIDAVTRRAAGQPVGEPRVYEVRAREGDTGAPSADHELTAGAGARVITNEAGLPIAPAGNPVNGLEQTANMVSELVALETRDTLALADAVDDVFLRADELEGWRAVWNDKRRGWSRIVAWAAGRAPGFIGSVQDMRQGLYVGLSRVIADRVAPLKVQADGVLRDGLNNGTIKYKGPKGTKAEKWFATHPVETIQTFAQKNPEWFDGLAEWQRINNQFLELGDLLVERLKNLGYPIKELDDYLAPLHFDVPVNQLSRTRKSKQGLVQTAKKRDQIYNYVQALEEGVPLRALTYGERWAVHFDALARAFSDVFERNLIIERYGTKGKISAYSKKFAAFESPLFKGYHAPKEVVDAIDAVHDISPQKLQTFRSVSSKTKNTSFGLFDLAVSGVHLPFALTHGGFALIAGGINNMLRLAHVPGAIDLSDPQNIFAARFGVRQGASAYNIDLGDGTLLGLLGKNNAIERGARKWSNFLSHIQFDRVMTPVRNQMFRGNLVMLHLMGKDITDPQTVRAAARAANRFTLTSEGAHNTIRRDLEHSLLVSANSFRAEFGVTFGHLANMAKLYNDGKLLGPEWALATMSLAWTGAMIYAVNAGAQQVLGHSVTPFDPFDKDFGSIKLGDTNIRFLKEASLLNAVRKSYRAIGTTDPEKLAQAWEQFIIGKTLTPASGAYGLATGHGYDTEGFFRTGEDTLDTNQRFLNLIPAAPIIDRWVYDKTARTDFAAMALEFGGFNTWQDGPKQQRDDFVRANNPYPETDPRFADVVNFGYDGLEREEREALKYAHPELFEGSASYDDDTKRILQRMDELQDNLVQIEDAVKADPYKRREYKDTRRDIVTEMAKLWEGHDKGKDNTLQQKAVTLYFDTLNAARTQSVGGVLAGDEYGKAEEAARKAVAEQFDVDGEAALDRFLSVGSTPLETEYRTDRQTIRKSGYYDIPDVVAAQLGFEDEATFRESIAEYAKDLGIEPKEVPALTEVESRIDKAKQAWRVAHPEIDALLVIWDGLTPRSDEAAALAGRRLSRTIDKAEDVKSKSERKKYDSQESLNELISSLR